MTDFFKTLYMNVGIWNHKILPCIHILALISYVFLLITKKEITALISIVLLIASISMCVYDVAWVNTVWFQEKVFSNKASTND